jgi:predicted ATPase
VARVAGGKALPDDVRQQVVAKTDGVPLFVEELTKMVLESGLLQEQEDRYELTGPLPPLAIPATLHDSLMARLDRLAAVKAMAQLGATLGREFSYELLQAVSLWDEGTLQQGLHQLVAAEFLYQRGVPPQATYVFKHALIQEAAYQSLLKSTRQQYHQRIAQVLEARFAEVCETQPELMAQHYTEAGLVEPAIPYWQRAGQRASERSAYVEAIGHLTKALEVLRTLPDTPELTQRELTLHIALGAALNVTKGFAAPELEGAYARACELCRQVGETPELFPVLWGLWGFYLNRGALQTAHELAEELLKLAKRVEDPALLLQAHHTLGPTLFHLGRVSPARRHLEQAIALYDPPQHRSHAFTYGGHDPGVCCRMYAARTQWLLGYPDQAVQRSHEALSLAQKIAHPFSLAHGLCFAAGIHQFRREGQAVQEQAEAAMALSTEQGFASRLVWGILLRGWALAEQGQGEEGIAQMRQGWAARHATGAEADRPYLLALLGEGYGRAGRIMEGLHVLAEALAVMDTIEERYYEADLYRLKGALLLMHAAEQDAEAEACFHQALMVMTCWLSPVQSALAPVVEPGYARRALQTHAKGMTGTILADGHTHLRWMAPAGG